MKQVAIDRLGTAFGHILQSTTIRNKKRFEQEMATFIRNCGITLTVEEAQLFINACGKAYGGNKRETH